MRWIPFPLVLLGILGLLTCPQPAAACTFCGGGLTARQTLREHFSSAKFVALGTLKNPRLDPTGAGGTTDFPVSQALKSDGSATLAAPNLIVPRYLPVPTEKPAEHILFFALTGGKLDLLHAVPGSAVVADYIREAGKLDPRDTPARLRFFFRHLDSDNPTIADDAFLEFGKASDSDIVLAKKHLDPAKLRKLLQDPKTPVARLGVFAMMLGLCGNEHDANWLAAQTLVFPMEERFASNLGGILTGLTLLKPEAGWAATQRILAAEKQPPSERLSAIGTVRFFQGTRTADFKEQVLRSYRAVITQGELADLAIDDLRRWSWWELTPEVLAIYESKNAPLFRRGVVRYALCCPTPEAKKFLATVRGKDPKLVATVEESLKLFENR